MTQYVPLLLSLLVVSALLGPALSWPEQLGRCAAVLPSEQRVVVPGYGIVEGTVHCHHVAFLGLPYAQPPVEGLRWRPPAPLAPHPPGQLRTFNATRRSPSCMQLRSGPMSGLEKMLLSVGDGESEDCLYLDVFVPRPSRAAPSHPSSSEHRLLPVVVFIHGGAFSTGGSAAPLYDPVDLMVGGMDGSVLFVTLNYRLGMFGYAASKALLDESSDPVGNYGLLDQLTAINWVKQNIAAFKGDPEKITVMGHSAGAMSASYLQLLHPTLVSKWILLSGTAMGWHYRRADGVFENTVWGEVARRVGCDAGDVGALRSVPAAELIAVSKQLSLDYSFGPCIDGRLILSSPDGLLGGLADSGPTLITTVRDEASLFIASLIKQPGDFERLTRAIIADPDVAAAVLSHYPPAGFSSDLAAANAAVTDAMFVCPAVRLYNALKARTRCRFALFEHPMVVPSLVTLFGQGRDYGVFHGSDLLLLFNPQPFVSVAGWRQAIEMRAGLRRFVHDGAVDAPIAAAGQRGWGGDGQVWRNGERVLFRGKCQAVWSLLRGRPLLPVDFRTTIGSAAAVSAAADH